MRNTVVLDQRTYLINISKMNRV